MNPFVVMKDKKNRDFYFCTVLRAIHIYSRMRKSGEKIVYRLAQWWANAFIALNRFGTHILHNALQELIKSNYRQWQMKEHRATTTTKCWCKPTNSLHSSYFWFDECHRLLLRHVFMPMDFLSIVESFFPFYPSALYSFDMNVLDFYSMHSQSLQPVRFQMIRTDFAKENQQK